MTAASVGNPGSVSPQTAPGTASGAPATRTDAEAGMVACARCGRLYRAALYRPGRKYCRAACRARAWEDQRIQRAVAEARREQRPQVRVVVGPGRALAGPAFPGRSRRERARILAAAQAVLEGEARP